MFQQEALDSKHQINLVLHPYKTHRQDTSVFSVRNKPHIKAQWRRYIKTQLKSTLDQTIKNTHTLYVLYTVQASVFNYPFEESTKVCVVARLYE